MASDAAEAMAHSSVVEQVKGAASHAVDAVTHSAAYEAAQHAAQNLVAGTKQVLNSSEQPAPEPASAPEPAPAPAEGPSQSEEAKVNQTGTEGFDEAEAVTKPVNEDGQEGEHPKPEIEL